MGDGQLSDVLAWLREQPEPDDLMLAAMNAGPTTTDEIEDPTDDEGWDHG